jgi:16S rRNA (guanine966-N2)-methyltransferase
MRIVAGSRKGHRIDAPKGVVTRPTSDRVREAVFSMLGSVEGARVLDLFAGSGAMGLEALSRGAAHTTFVERDAAAARVVERNLEKLGLRDAANVLRQDAARAVRSEGAAGRSYDLVLVDAPYAEWPSLEAGLGALLRDVVAGGGRLVVETAATTEPQLPLDLVTTRRYGSARITVFQQ